VFSIRLTSYILLIFFFCPSALAGIRTQSDSFMIDPEFEGVRLSPTDSRIPLSLLSSRLLRAENRNLGVRQKREYELDLRSEIPEFNHRLKQLFEAARPISPQPNDELEFFKNIFSEPSAKDRALIEAFFLNPRRAKGLQSAREKTIRNLIAQKSESSFLVKTQIWSAQELQTLIKLVNPGEMQLQEFGDFTLVGRGKSFWALEQVLKQAENLNDPEKQRLVERAIKVAANEQILHVYQFTVGSAGQFDPISEQIIFSMLSRANVGTWVHEIEHFRFQRFTNRLQTWLKKRRYVMPYHVDGPSEESGGAFGDIFLLLNEINSWRKDLRLQDSQEKAEEKVLSLYRHSVGAETRALLDSNSNRLQIDERSISTLLRHEILLFNQIPTELISSNLDQALQSKDLFRATSLMRLAESRSQAITDRQKRDFRQLMNDHKSQYLESPDSVKASEIAQLKRLLKNADNHDFQSDKNRLHDLDLLLSTSLFDGKNDRLKLDLVSDLMQTFLPQELPKTYEKILVTLQSPKEVTPNHLLARYFLMSSPKGNGPPSEWSLRLSQDLELRARSHELSDRTREALFIFYEHSLPNLWQGRSSEFELPLTERQRLVRAREQINEGLNSKSRMVHQGAASALLSHQIFRNQTRCEQIWSY